MAMDKKVFAISKKDDKSIASGFDHAQRTGNNTFSVYFTDGSKVDLLIPLPADGVDGKDGVSISDAKIVDDKLVVTLSDGTELAPLEMPATPVKVSKESGNALTEKADGLYVYATGVEISADTDNAIETKADGLFVKKSEVKISTKADNIIKAETDGLYAKADEVKASTKTDNALSVESDGSLYVPKADAQVQSDYTQTDSTKADFIKNKPTVDATISATSENAVQNKVVKAELDKKVDAVSGKSLVADTDITQITTNKTSIETLNGDDTVDGSVAKQIKGATDEITEKLSKKVDIQQAVADKGKVLIVGEDGKLILGYAEADLTEVNEKIDDINDSLVDLEDDLGELSELTTTDKSNLVGAVNEVANGVGVTKTNPSDMDLNNYKTNGRYTIGTWVNYSNAPFSTTDGTMLVEDTGAYKTQIAIHRSTGAVKTRLFADGTWTDWKELATMNKVNAFHNATTGYITGSLLGSVVKNANLYYQKFGDKLVINGWVGIDAVSAKTPMFTLPNDWEANSNYLIPCYAENSNVACACLINIGTGTVNAYTPLPTTAELRFCGEIYLR